MRVISGKYRGRRLKGPSGTELRPTGDRLKESLFNILRPNIAGGIVIDTFGGTGAIGIEALSRGAKESVFIESDAAGCRLIRKNLELCGIQTGYRILQEDVFASLRSLARHGFKANIAFFDPPYNWKPYGDPFTSPAKEYEYCETNGCKSEDSDCQLLCEPYTCDTAANKWCDINGVWHPYGDLTIGANKEEYCITHNCKEKDFDCATKYTPDEGLHYVRVKVRDNEGLYDYQDVSINIIPTT